MQYDDIDMNYLDRKDSFGVFKIPETPKPLEEEKKDPDPGFKKDPFRAPLKRETAPESKFSQKFSKKKPENDTSSGGGDGGEKKPVGDTSADFKFKTAVLFQEKLSVLEDRDKLLRQTVFKTSNKNMSVIAVGTCPDMCPEKERLLREITCSFSVFEGEIVHNEMHVVPELLVKEYSRSSADQDEPLPHELRPQPVLMDTMNHIVLKIIPQIDSASVDLMEWYHFCWDRLRSLRKDIIQQQLCSIDIVTILEQSARFHISCGDRLFGTDTKVFDEKINAENLVNCLQMLISMYENLEKKGIRCENETEFRVYMMLLLLDSGDIPDVIQWHDERSKRQCEEAKEIFFAFKQNLYTRFFRLVKKTTYLNACILQRYFSGLKTQVLNILVNAYSSSRQPAKFSFAFMKKVLEFDSDEEMIVFVENHGFTVVDNEVRGTKMTFSVPDIKVVCPTSHILRSKRIPVLEAVSGVPNFKPDIKLGKVHSSFDRNDMLKQEAWNAEDQRNKVIQVYGNIYENMNAFEDVDMPSETIDEVEEEDDDDDDEEEMRISPIHKPPETTFSFKIEQPEPKPPEQNLFMFKKATIKDEVKTSPKFIFNISLLPPRPPEVPEPEPVPPVTLASIRHDTIVHTEPMVEDEEPLPVANLPSPVTMVDLYDPEEATPSVVDESEMDVNAVDEGDLPTVFVRNSEDVVNSLQEALKEFENLYSNYFEATNAENERQRQVTILQENRRLRKLVKRKLKQNNARKYFRMWRKKMEITRKKHENFIGIVHLPLDEYFKLWGTVKNRNLIPKNIVGEAVDRENAVKWSTTLVNGKSLSVNYIGDRVAELIVQNVRTRCAKLRMKMKTILCWKVVVSLPSCSNESITHFASKVSEFCQLLFNKTRGQELSCVQEECTGGVKVFISVAVETGIARTELVSSGMTSLVLYACENTEPKEKVKERLLSLVCTNVSHPVHVHVVSNDCYKQELIICLTLLKKKKKILGWSLVKWENFFTIPKVVLKGTQYVPWTPDFEVKSLTQFVASAGEEFFLNLCFLLNNTFPNSPITYIKLYNTFLVKLKEVLYGERREPYNLSSDFLTCITGRKASRNTLSDQRLIKLVDRCMLISFTKWPPKSVEKMISLLNKYCSTLDANGTLLANVLRLIDAGASSEDDVQALSDKAPWLKIVELWFKYNVQLVEASGDTDNVNGNPLKMWSPTHVQVTVQRAKGLVSKGHNGVFVTIGLGKEKYQTSVKERELDEIEWHEKCELKIPSHGNTQSIVLTVLTHNFLGVDNFLGCLTIPLVDLDVYDRPKNKWFELQDRQGKPKTKDRGELEIKIGFSVKPGSLNDVSKKESRRASMGQLSHAAHNVGGSLASISSVDKKSFKKLAKTITRKIKKDKKLQEEDSPEDGKNHMAPSRQAVGDADPGVISDDDEFAFDDLSHTGSGCSLEVAQVTNNHSGTGSVETVASSETLPTPLKENKFNTLPTATKPARSITPIQEKFVHKWEQKLQEAKKTRAMLNKSSERIVVGGESKSVSPSTAAKSRLSPQVLQQYEGKSREELIETIYELKIKLGKVEKDRKELEDYIDNLLLRVIEHSPSILQNPFS